MATSPNFSWPEPDNTDLVKNGALAIRTAVDAIDSSLVDLKGGTTGQVLSKASNTDMDFTWVAQDDSNAIQNAIVDAKGDLIAATAADTPARLAVGTNGQVLTADSTAATGLAWATPSTSGGKIGQVVTVYTTSATGTTSTSYVDVSGVTASITPTSSSSKILIMINASLSSSANEKYNGTFARILRGSTAIYTPAQWKMDFATSTAPTIVSGVLPYTMIYTDSPATTSSTTYKMQIKSEFGSITSYVNDPTYSVGATITLMEILP